MKEMKRNELPKKIVYQCPDCSRPMDEWSKGETPNGDSEPRIKCTQCGRWQWQKDGEVLVI